MNKKTKKILFITLGIPVGLFLILLLWANWDFIGLTKDTFSIDYGINKKILSFDTERDFHGDGFSIEVYQLDKMSQDYFKNPPSEFFSQFPKRDFQLEKRKIYKWSKTPQRTDDIYRTGFATTVKEEDWYIFQDDKCDLIKKYLAYADTLLKTEGNY